MRSRPEDLRPAIERAIEISASAADRGFDWPDVSGVLDKIAEEARELTEARSIEEVTHEYGDLLFTLVNLGRFLGVAPEAALHDASDRFVSRFDGVVQGLKAEGRGLEDATLDEMEAHWQRAKSLERS